MIPPAFQIEANQQKLLSNWLSFLFHSSNKLGIFFLSPSTTQREKKGEKLTGYFFSFL
jgi:hypothetical protein